MQIIKAHRKHASIKLGIQGPAGSGKTYSSLLLAYGLCGDWNKIAVIDTEHYSASLYAHLGAYQVLPLEPPYTPERYIEAIEQCLEAGMQVIILDSISHEWGGSGGILEVHGRMTGNSFTNWSKVTPRHNGFVDRMLQSPCHLIATIRTKQAYVLNQVNGKYVPEKVGLKGITREGMDYELTTVLNLDMQHKARASKDRTGLFESMPAFTITPRTGQRIRQWCEQTTNSKPLKTQ